MKKTITSVDGRVETLLVEVHWPMWNTVWPFFQKLDVE